jgi:type III restriction enzyme
MPPRPQQEIPPDDWAPAQAVEEPILNSPYEEPQYYWNYDKDGTPNKFPGRRPASYWFKTERTGVGATDDLFAEEDRDDLPLVNRLREDVKRWRESGYRGATSVTKELLQWWLRDDRPRRLFFCQQEAVETVIYLLELAIPGRLQASGFKKFGVDADAISKLLAGEKPDFPRLRDDFFPRLIDPSLDPNLIALRRMACKMATGSGKTVVMAMLIAWAFCNRGRNPASSQFPHGILICAPNLTVRKRLQVLSPDDPDNYYDQFDLVPPKYREFLSSGKVLVTNWHVFSPKSEHSEGGKSYAVVDKGKETHEAFAKDRLKELAQRLPILVFNDEGHHCWRGRDLSDDEEKKILRDRSREEKAELKDESKNARVWLAGLDRINNSGFLGRKEKEKLVPGIITCVDLSATPFYLGNSGYPEGSPFPWVVSDFGLVDAIESGITKIPRLPVKDDTENKDEAGRPDPVYFRLWETIKAQLKPEDYITKSKPKPEAIYKYAEGALSILAGQWKIQFEEVKKHAKGKPFIPPVLIVICDNTDIAEVFHQNISGEEEYETTDENGKTIKDVRYNESRIFPELKSYKGQKCSIRIDSKLLQKIETDEGESRDEAGLRLRELIDSVGKRGGTGEQVRSVVSVSMLTEGWDANNVTHILGVRAFGTQLLCEQVVGRGLRRMSYEINPETGHLNPEYVDVYGIPFSLIPFKGKPKENTPGDPVYNSIHAMPERNEFEIRMPNVESYVYDLRESGIKCDVDSLEEVLLDKEPDEVYLAAPRGYQDQVESRKDEENYIRQTRDEYYKSIRLQQIVFRLTQLIVDDLIQGATNKTKIGKCARHQLFPEILSIINEFVQKKVKPKTGVDIRELGLQRYVQLVRERVRDGILPAVAKEESKLLPVLNSFQPYTTTSNVNYQTTKKVADLVKSHLNRAAIDAISTEGKAIEMMELEDCVECYTPNDRQIGLIIPYEYDEHFHNYEPDFVIRLSDGFYVLLETKGGGGMRGGQEDKVNAKNAAAQKWVAAVNNMKKFGHWHFVYNYQDISGLREELRKLAGDPKSNRPFSFVKPDNSTAWKTCLPLVTVVTAVEKLQIKQLNLDVYSDWSDDWITWDDMPDIEEGMFVARILGKAMEPDISSGAYAIFLKTKKPSIDSIVLLSHPKIFDPHTGTNCTVVVLENKEEVTSVEDRKHSRLTIRWSNPDYGNQTIEIEPGESPIFAQYLAVLGSV